MASGRRSCLAALLIGGMTLVSACAADTAASEPVAAGEPSTTTTTSLATTTTTATPTTATLATTTTTAPTSTTTSAFGDLGADVRVPSGDGPFPAVVLVHGGGWVAGDPRAMSELALYLTENDYLTINTRYKLATQDAGFPGAVDDVACATRLAAAHPDSNGLVTVIGHSAGAHLSALVALNGDDYGSDCPYPEAPLPENLIGLAGPYDVERVGLLMLPFFGGGPEVEPEAWDAGNPLNFVAENPTLSSLIMYAENDSLVEPNFAIQFYQALLDAGSDVTLELVEDARHMDLRDPDVVGDLMITWLKRSP